MSGYIAVMAGSVFLCAFLFILSREVYDEKNDFMKLLSIFCLLLSIWMTPYIANLSRVIATDASFGSTITGYLGIGYVVLLIFAVCVTMFYFVYAIGVFKERIEQEVEEQINISL